MNEANLMHEASINMLQAADLNWKAAQMNAEMEMMKASNQEHIALEQSPVYTERDFDRVLDLYRARG